MARISNLKTYLGGADNVIVRDIIEGDQLGFRFDLGQTSLAGYTYEVDTELFNATTSTRGTNITLTSFVKATEENIRTFTGNNAAVINNGGKIQLETNSIVNAADNMSATLTVPSDLLSNLTTANALIDSTTPFIVAMSISLISPGAATKHSFRMLWIIRYRPITDTIAT